MSHDGDKPHDPQCALGRVIDGHNEDAFRWRLLKSYRVAVINLDDERLSVNQRNGLKDIVNTIYGERPHGE